MDKKEFTMSVLKKGGCHAETAEALIFVLHQQNKKPGEIQVELLQRFGVLWSGSDIRLVLNLKQNTGN